MLGAAYRLFRFLHKLSSRCNHASQQASFEGQVGSEGQRLEREGKAPSTCGCKSRKQIAYCHHDQRRNASPHRRTHAIPFCCHLPAFSTICHFFHSPVSLRSTNSPQSLRKSPRALHSPHTAHIQAEEEGREGTMRALPPPKKLAPYPH